MTPNGVAVSPILQLRSICDTTAGRRTDAPTTTANSAVETPATKPSNKACSPVVLVPTNNVNSTVSPMFAFAHRFNMIRKLMDEVNVYIGQLYDLEGLEKNQSLLLPRNDSSPA
jgi:hypothetical protein